MQADPYATGVLDPARDERLVAGLAKFSRDAGIQPHWVWTSIKGVVGSEESNYLRAFRRHMAHGTRSGLCYVGSENASDISDRMCAVAGLLTRDDMTVLARNSFLGSFLSDAEISRHLAALDVYASGQR